MNEERFPSAVPKLQDCLSLSAKRLPEKVALVYRGERLTYRELEARTDALANALVRCGVGRGDRVLVFGDNGIETVVSFWAVLKANAVVSIVSPLTKSDKLAYLLNDSEAIALIADGALAATFMAAARRAPLLVSIVVWGKGVDEPDLSSPATYRSWDEVVAAESSDGPPAKLGLDIDLAALVYTSGSTGEPKGVMLTHRNMLAASTSVSAYLGNVESDVIVCVLPLAFDYGLYQMIMAFRAGARLVLERAFRYPTRVLQAMQDEKVTAFPGVPTIFAMLAEIENIEKYDLSSVRYVTNTAAALPVKHIGALKGMFPAAKIFSMYGLTECKRCTYLPPDDIDRKPTSVGIAIPNTEIWLVDENDRSVGPHQVGQLVVRGATVMAGYWRKPEETANRLRSGPIPGERVLYTGDCCKMDEEGYLYYVARMDDIIKSRGEKVSPKEVENAIVNIDGVREAAVIGVPDPLLGQAIKAFVVLEKGRELREKDIQRECQRWLESFMAPKYVEIVSDLPRTATGKVKKTALA